MTLVAPANLARIARARRGTAYLLIAAVIALVAIMALAGAMANQIAIRQAALSVDAQRAEVLAESAVSWAIARINADSNWRTTFTNNVEVTRVAAQGGGTMSFKLVDETDGNLSNAPTHAVRVYGYGRYGRATRVLSVVLTGSTPLPALSNALTVGGNMTLSNATLNASGRTIHCNGTVSGGSGSVNINANLSSSVSINLLGINLVGVQLANQPQMALPDANAFDYYLAVGTRIPWSSISGGAIDRKLITPASSGYFFVSANDRGVYVIDCEGNDIQITRSRIVGTIVLLNPGSGSRIGLGGGVDALHWTPADPGMPCLLVKGNISMSFNMGSGAQLNEASETVNFNPSNSPYPWSGGTTDSDQTDSYPSRIEGLIYVSGNLTSNAQRNTAIGNTIVGGNYSVTGDNVTFTHYPTYAVYAPPGFGGAGTMMPMASTWRWEAQ
jgi:hypothetical protein